MDPTPFKIVVDDDDESNVSLYDFFLFFITSISLFFISISLFFITSISINPDKI